jgi:HlyD family secretion protein
VKTHRALDQTPAGQDHRSGPKLALAQRGMDRPIPKKRWTLKRLAGLGAIALFVGLSLYGFLRERGTSRLRVDPEKLTLSPVARGVFQEFIPVRGTLLPLQTVYLDAMEGGRVEQVFAEEGSVVAEGEPLLRLASPELQVQLLNQEAQLDERRDQARTARLALQQQLIQQRREQVDLDFELHQARRNYERYAQLASDHLIARKEYEDAKDGYDHLLKRRELTLETQRQDSLLGEAKIQQLEEGVARQQRHLDLLRQRLDRLVLRAPVAGQLTSLHAEIGESKGQGQRLGQLDKLDGFKVRAEIDEHYLNRVQIGQRGTFEQEGGELGLLVKKVYPEVREGRFEVDLLFEGAPPAGIKRGQTLQVRLELGALEEAVLLPRGGFYQKTGGNWAYVLDPEGTQASRRPIRLGRQNPLFFEVLEGLEPGERVITSGYDNFGDVDVLVLK